MPPESHITRQDMATILYRVLSMLNKLPERNAGKALEDFYDSGEIASYAAEAVELFVKTGILAGSNNNLFPRDTTTRAQAAQVLYNLMSKF